ncbi:UNVERIFIED_CONTAM: hypothetical protein K2H54_053592 [Gekko kuhli]
MLPSTQVQHPTDSFALDPKYYKCSTDWGKGLFYSLPRALKFWLWDLHEWCVGEQESAVGEGMNKNNSPTKECAIPLVQTLLYQWNTTFGSDSLCLSEIPCQQSYLV